MNNNILLIALAVVLLRLINERTICIRELILIFHVTLRLFDTEYLIISDIIFRICFDLFRLFIEDVTLSCTGIICYLCIKILKCFI